MVSIRKTSIALSCALLLFFGGLWLGGHPQSLPEFLRNAFVDDDRALRAEIINTVEDNFYKPVKESKLEEASLRGIVDALKDPFSQYISPAEARRFRESISGKFDGVGMSVEKDRQGLRVLNVFDNTPAQRVGIHKGDLIVSVNDRSIAKLSSAVATARIKGPPGTTVRLEVITPSTKRSRKLTVKRERIEVPVAEGRLVRHAGHKLAVIRLVGFSEGAHGLLRRQIEQQIKRGSEGAVLDLRGNGGGLLREGVLVASNFLKDGKIVSIRGRARAERVEKATGGALDTKLPLVVLVDGGSASASEIVAGALRDRHRATLVGTRTFGKGLVQEIQPLSNGGVLDLTVANYYLPNGETIPLHKGLKPQIRARDVPKTRKDEALPIALDALLKQTR
jgi:carboxyl-terminal processing protease